MKKHLLVLPVVFMLLITAFAQAQNTLAKLIYEDAEEAYIAKDYPLALTKLAEAETLLKSSNPKLMYLKISVQAKMVQDPTNTDFTLLDNTRKLAALYLKNYESVPDNEDKYRDVYKISEALKKYPATEKAFIAKFNKPQAFLDSLCLAYKFKTGLTIEQFSAYNPEARFLFEEKHYILAPGDFSYGVYTDKLGPQGIGTKNGIVTSYTLFIYKGDTATEARAVFNEGKEKLKAIPNGQFHEYATGTYVTLGARGGDVILLLGLAKADKYVYYQFVGIER